MELEDRFERAVDAIVAGELTTLEALLRETPALVQTRSARPHRATLLHYLGANGVEDYRQKSPRNAVAVAKMLLDSGADPDVLAEIYGKSTSLGLVASSIHPREEGVQIGLMEALLASGAAIDAVSGACSPILSALRNGHQDSAEFLSRRGAALDLESAAGVGRLDVVQSFFNEGGKLKANATKTQMELGLMWACEYGRNDVVDYLLNRGIDIHAQASTGQTSLHWAAIGGQLQTIELLLARGASLEAKNVHGATALEQALWSAKNGGGAVEYGPVIERLTRAGAFRE